MDKIQQSLASGEWWFSVVLVGTVVGILGTLAVRILDRYWSRWTEALSTRSKRDVEKQDERARTLQKYPHKISFAQFEVQRQQFAALWLVVVGVSALGASTVIAVFADLMGISGDGYIAGYLLMAISSLSIIASFSCQAKAMSITRVLRKAEKLIMVEAQRNLTGTKTNDSVHSDGVVSEK